MKHKLMKRLDKQREESRRALKEHQLREEQFRLLKEKKIKKKRKLIAITVICFLAFIALVSYVWFSPGKYDEFAKCLTEKGFVMAGTDWCNYCKKQKALFGKSFTFVNYKNCDLNKAWCDSNGVDSYPTWILPDGTKRTGLQELYLLSQLSSGCGLK